MRSADKAWLALAAGILAYELGAPEHELMSEGCDRYLEARPWLTRAVVAAVAGHLLNLTPRPVDPLHWLSVLKRR
jgi:hypothetical protein